jgi:hypothetical protein
MNSRACASHPAVVAKAWHRAIPGATGVRGKLYRIITPMARIDFYIKVHADVSEDDTPQKLAQEICRQVERVYGVRYAELQSFHKEGEE